MAEIARVQKLGPDGFNKIGIIGSAPSSVRLAPYHDRSWGLWGCSPGVYGVAPYGRLDVFWEIHRWEPPTPGDPTNPKNKPWFSPEYVQFLQNFPGPVMLSGPSADVDNPVPSVKNGWRFPFEDYVARYSPYFFTSSMAWMLAHAIETILSMRTARNVPKEGEAIGLWGVDMAAHSEYAFQRPGCQHFIGIAIKLGIPIILPPESDLMQPPTLYGIGEYNPRQQKLLARLTELQTQEQQHAAAVGTHNQQLMHVRGCIDDLKYVFNTWVDDIDPHTKITSAVSMAGVTLSRPDAVEAALERLDPVDQEVAAQPVPLEPAPAVAAARRQPAPARRPKPKKSIKKGKQRRSK